MAKIEFWAIISKLLLASVHSKNPNDQTLFSHQGQHSEEDHGGDFISEARDWAGELISAQTMMGKILVMIIIIHSIALYHISLLSGVGNQNRNPNINNRDHLVGDQLRN